MNNSPNETSPISDPQETLVYLVRHGETNWNRERRFQGHLDVPLSTQGRRQAEAVATWLSQQPVSFSAVYSSDLERAAQTAQAIGERLGLTPIYAQELREIHCGDWDGLLVEEIENRYPGKLDEWREIVDRCPMPGGESLAEVQRRIFGFYERMIRQHTGGAIVIVSHRAALSALQAAMHGWDLAEAWRSRRARMGNTGVTVVIRNNATGEHRTILSDSAEHLTVTTGRTGVFDPQPEAQAAP